MLSHSPFAFDPGTQLQQARSSSWEGNGSSYSAPAQAQFPVSWPPPGNSLSVGQPEHLSTAGASQWLHLLGTCGEKTATHLQAGVRCAGERQTPTTFGLGAREQPLLPTCTSRFTS